LTSYPTAASFLPAAQTLPAARHAARGCRGCDLWTAATQTVFGVGDSDARLMLVGEMPGDEEDLRGTPFVGPAGRLLDRALVAAGIDRSTTYITNVVKHFRWEPRGKRRLHRKPSVGQIDACLPWLRFELAAVRPKALVCLGSTAAQALLGKQFLVSRQRGAAIESPLAPIVMATVHPSSLLRIRSASERAEAMRRFVGDLIVVRRALR
jgi:uracil-DNA glycosylase family protein